MDRVINIAVVGTAQTNTPDMRQHDTHTPVDMLTHALANAPFERTLLLAAGSQAVYQQAGQVLPKVDGNLPVAPTENIPSCSPQAAYLLENLMQQKDFHDLLPEALDLLRQRHLRLPHSSLPKALVYGTQNKDIRAALIAVCGERARWLGRLNNQWAWATQFIDLNEHTLPIDAEIIWQEGNAGQREEILRRLRTHDPIKARAWLAATWKQEKGETRAAFLNTFENRLSDDDLPLLLQALEDRSESVRVISASLLARLTNSPQAQELVRSVDLLLDYKNGKIRVAKATDFTITAQWIQNVTIAKTKHDVPDMDNWTKKQIETFWTAFLQEALARVPPKHWEERFRLSPSRLIDALHDHPWQQFVIAGWAQAALFHHDSDWYQPLLYWYNRMNFTDQVSMKNYQQLLIRLPQADAETIVAPLLDHDDTWHRVLIMVPAPWRRDFSLRCLEILRERLRSLALQQGYGEWYSFWPPVLKKTARSIDASCFDAALVQWELAQGVDWYQQQLQQRVQEFTGLVAMRQQMLEAIKHSSV